MARPRVSKGSGYGSLPLTFVNTLLFCLPSSPGHSWPFFLPFAPERVSSTSFWGRGALEVCKGGLDINSALNNEDEAGPIAPKQPHHKQGALVFLSTAAMEIPRASTLAVSAVS